MTKQTRVAVVTKGHPFDKTAFFALMDAMPGLGWCHVEQPLAQELFDPELAREFDAFVLYDMPGIHFRSEGPPDFEAPTDEFKARYQSLLQTGFGFVFLHHAIAGWPAWDFYGRSIGGRFSYLPGPFAGTDRPDSGYRHSVTHEIEVLADHPLTAGLPARFSMTDELYLYDVLEADVTPLLRSGHRFTDDGFYSARQAVAEGQLFSREGWQHPGGSSLVGWVRAAGPSRIAYLQGGDDPVAYADRNFRQVLGNAIHWAAAHGD